MVVQEPTVTYPEEHFQSARVARGKQNNLRISAFRNRLVDWSALYTEVERFGLGEQSIATTG